MSETTLEQLMRILIEGPRELSVPTLHKIVNYFGRDAPGGGRKIDFG